ncbi:MAG: hypothetical protein NC548_39900, partial [Lachnospiraceae bacterium]|nr:hypothetical protein [Lachnospiraceae bacterium]
NGQPYLCDSEISDALPSVKSVNYSYYVLSKHDQYVTSSEVLSTRRCKCVSSPCNHLTAESGTPMQ